MGSKNRPTSNISPFPNFYEKGKSNQHKSAEKRNALFIHFQIFKLEDNPNNKSATEFKTKKNSGFEK